MHRFYFTGCRCWRARLFTKLCFFIFLLRIKQKLKALAKICLSGLFICWYAMDCSNQSRHILQSVKNILICKHASPANSCQALCCSNFGVSSYHHICQPIEQLLENCLSSFWTRSEQEFICKCKSWYDLTQFLVRPNLLSSGK